MRPLQGTVVLELAHQSGVHQQDKVHMPGLAQSVPELTRAHAHMLLPVPMHGLRPSPTSLIDLQDAVGFPVRAVGDQHLARLFGLALRPQHPHAYGVSDFWAADRLAEVSLRVACNRELGAQQRRERPAPGADARRLPTDHNSAIGFQVANGGAPFAVDVIHHRGIGEIAVKGEIARDVVREPPINQLFGQVGVALEGMLVITLLALAEAPEGERVMLA
jgi:hypothetical protein